LKSSGGKGHDLALLLMIAHVLLFFPGMVNIVVL